MNREESKGHNMIQSAGNSVRKHVVCYIRRNATPHYVIPSLCVAKVRRNSCRKEICEFRKWAGRSKYRTK
jgi:hypothetical protein